MQAVTLPEPVSWVRSDQTTRNDDDFLSMLPNRNILNMLLMPHIGAADPDTGLLLCNNDILMSR